MSQLLNFFKTKQGRIVIVQAPNSPLIGWFIFTILNLIWNSHQPQIHYFFHLVSFGFIFTWAWLEITNGVNYFRRALGLIILIIAILLFK